MNSQAKPPRRQSRSPATEVIDMPDDLRIAASPIADAKRGKARFPLGRPFFEQIALLLQGGGALGAYQAGVYEALAEADLHPDWVAGISIGAINSALIAGNPPETRVDRLRSFWESVTPSSSWAGVDGLASMLMKGDAMRGFINQMSATMAASAG